MWMLHSVSSLPDFAAEIAELGNSFQPFISVVIFCCVGFPGCRPAHDFILQGMQAPRSGCQRSPCLLCNCWELSPEASIPPCAGHPWLTQEQPRQMSVHNALPAPQG